ncbi:MAG: barstar family protein [Oscillospiraceae bacterium]|nr:barstar family protein [Oscillospiraceae bacterium]
MPTKEAAHTYLAEKLSFPAYYGRNLDALYDVLSAETEVPVCLVIYRREELEKSLGAYGALLLETIRDAVRTNPNLQVVYDGDER